MAHQHAYHNEDLSRCVELPSESGIGVCLQAISHSTEPNETPHSAGFIISHDVPGQTYRCEGGLTIDDAHFPHKWTQTGSLEAGGLTLTPSVLCTEHPSFHAYITNGRWTG